jgi:hypothetical protein
LNLLEINLIKTQIEDNKAKEKREKTVIVGDMKPMIDSLNDSKTDNTLTSLSSEKETSLFNLLTKPHGKSSNEVNQNLEDNAVKTTRKERREKNRANETAKTIQKQSIRTKKAYVINLN